MLGNKHTFTHEFKQEVVKLYKNGKSRSDLYEYGKSLNNPYENRKSRSAIVEKYELAASAPDQWTKQAYSSDSSPEKDNHSSEANELLKLRKENQRLRKENDILIQAALIMGRK